MHNSPTISVVTPVYNGERYLRECIESVLSQTRSDWEYLIVDNVSQDGSVAIAESYAARDSRIRVIRCSEFVNVHRSFNRAARLIDPRSRYCKFVSGDDWIYPECLERMVAVADGHPTVGVVSSYCLAGDRVDQDGVVPYTDVTMPGTEVVRRALMDRLFITGSPSQVLFRADLVRNKQAFFDETEWHSDTDAAYRSLVESDLGFVHQVLTFRRLHTSSLTSAFSHPVKTYKPHEIRMVIRYGHRVLRPGEYRTVMRSMLCDYGWWLLKQTAKLSRLRDIKYHTFHWSEISRLLAELGDDRQTGTILRVLRGLLRNVKTDAATAQPTAAHEGGPSPEPSMREIPR